MKFIWLDFGTETVVVGEDSNSTRMYGLPDQKPRFDGATAVLVSHMLHNDLV